MPRSGRASVQRARAPRSTAIATAAMLLVAVLAGCVASSPMPAPTPTTSSTPSATPTPEPDPEFVEGGTAGQNRPYFEFVMNGLLERSARPTSATIRNSLAEAGFALASIEVTEDTTRVGDLADSILIGILIDGQCLLGQVIGGELVTDLADVLGTGRCLVGRTASLD